MMRERRRTGGPHGSTIIGSYCRDEADVVYVARLKNWADQNARMTEKQIRDELTERDRITLPRISIQPENWRDNPLR